MGADVYTTLLAFVFLAINPSTVSSSPSSSSSSSFHRGHVTAPEMTDEGTPSLFLMSPPVYGLPWSNEGSEPIDYADLGEIRPYKGPEWYLVPIIFGTIFVVGTLGNGCLIFTVLRHKEMRTAPNYLLVSLAAGDLLLILISVPFSSTLYTFDYWPYGEFVCKLNEFLVAFSLGVTVFTLIALSFERYSVIVHPMRVGARRPVFKTVAVVGIVWFLAAGLATLELLAAHVSYDYAYYEIYDVIDDLYTSSRPDAPNIQQQQGLNESIQQQQQRADHLTKLELASTGNGRLTTSTGNLHVTMTTDRDQGQSTWTGNETLQVVSVTCDNHPKSWPLWYGKFNSMFKFVVYFAVPLLVITTFYVIMAKVLFASGRYLETNASGNHGLELQEMGNFSTGERRRRTNGVETLDRDKKMAAKKSLKEVENKSLLESRKFRFSVQLPVEGAGRNSSRPSIGMSHVAKQIESRKKVARLVLSFVVVFAVCWMPRHIYILWYRFDDGGYNMFWHVFKIGGFCLSFINSCINPFAVYFFSHQFRKYYIRYFMFFCRCFKPSRASGQSAAGIVPSLGLNLTPGHDDDPKNKTASRRKSIVNLGVEGGRRVKSKKSAS